jgi:hypothetical protein
VNRHNCSATPLQQLGAERFQRESLHCSLQG